MTLEQKEKSKLTFILFNFAIQRGFIWFFHQTLLLSKKTILQISTYQKQIIGGTNIHFLDIFLLLESNEESEDERKCNIFRSDEKSKYPAYMQYRTRAKSFNDCKVDWLKEKKEEFARYGFLYQGITIWDFVIFFLLWHIHTIQKKGNKNPLQLQE